MDETRVVTRSQLVADLASLGVAPGQCVMMHESVRNIGWVVGGPDTVIRAVLDVVGEQGTLMKLVGSEDGTYEVDEWPQTVRDAYLRERPTYDPERTRACREWGILCEYLRTWPGARRSAHPESSFAAVGLRADWLMDPHPLQDGYGPGSPLARLLEQGGKVLLLGAPLDSVTLIHHSEYIANVPHKRRVQYRAPVLVAGERRWLQLSELDSSKGIVEWTGEDYFALLMRDFLSTGAARSGRVGCAESHLIDGKDLHEYAVAWLERTLTQLVGSPR